MIQEVTDGNLLHLYRESVLIALMFCKQFWLVQVKNFILKDGLTFTALSIILVSYSQHMSAPM